jgi:hypothetical protein
MSGDPREGREQAKECLELANNAPSPLSKARFEELAQTWLRLARDLEHAQGLLKQWGDPKLRKTG